MSTQDGPVEAGQPPVVHMDLDRALAVLRAAVFPGLEDEAAALDALRALIDRARAYSRGPTSGRLVALCQVLQEPVPAPPEPVNVETVVQAYLTDRRMVAITHQTARALGVLVPEDLSGR